MAPENSLSLVALIVSLVALLMSLWQVLQSNFGTAEGRQRTNSAIMGNWADMTRWRWNWIEFRFVIKYVTPHIVIGATENLQESELYDQANPSGGRRFRKDRWRLNKFHVLGRDTMPENIEGRWKSPNGGLGWFRRRLHGLYWALAHLDPHEFDSEIMVSWDRLLQVAHNYQQSILSLQRQEWGSMYSGTQALPIPKTLEKQGESNSDSLTSTLICVKLKRRNWDYIPSDINRPLASTSLGDLMVLGQRLGMRWQEIRLHEGYLRAEGSGYTITSSSIRSFGLVARLSVRPEHSEIKSLGRLQAGLDLSNISADKLLIPSVHADQMLCGIVPGDPELVDRTYHTVGPDAKSHPEWMFNAIQTHGDVQQFCQKTNQTRTLINDAICCICPWMPLSTSPIVRIQHPIAWQGGYMGYKYSFMHFWEAREVLRVRLKRRCDQLSQKEKQEHTKFEYAQQKYDALAEHVAADDFYCRWKKSLIHPEGKVNAAAPNSGYEQAIKDRMDMLQSIKDIFDETQRFFEARNKADQLIHEEHFSVPPIKYLELVRAYLSALAIKVARPDFKANPDHNLEIDQMLSDKKHSGPGLARDIAEMTHVMVDQCSFVAEKLRFRDKNLVSDLDVEEAWWMLMLRGTCWNMSVWMEPPDAGALVPSSLYSDGSLVWIT
ncbi:uncharacterized protein LY89DRAFT_721274 [Mollisia scopiformis]|uniref:Uncharacterized protein n=1 Tax=Mollisia scopiformis TaxID=149040 RepID=A0A194WZ17_MOLSC|nr:uncharacterized protein LY89DRAFT_721274 [Mollisia scopiformis]KUJ13203.1 hypothetical protein LY89DRAFT_721274 [Mollisia scopiformis]